MATNTQEQQAAAKAQGLVRRPPSCANCKHAAAPMWAQPTFGDVYLPMRCQLGGFTVRKYYTCEKWDDKDEA